MKNIQKDFDNINIIKKELYENENNILYPA
jgi:hypothetical protein